MKNRLCPSLDLGHVIMATSLFTAVFLILIKQARDYGIYCRAESIAKTRIGDCKSPLDNSERNEWYSQMGVSDCRKPDISQLQNYIRLNNSSEN